MALAEVGCSVYSRRQSSEGAIHKAPPLVSASPSRRSVGEADSRERLVRPVMRDIRRFLTYPRTADAS